MKTNDEIYLKAILATVARQTFSIADLLALVAPTKKSEKQLKAFNLCTGDVTQGEIAKKLGLDSGNFSKTLAKWVDAGIIVKVGDGNDLRPVHVYPIPEGEYRKSNK